MAGSQSTSPIVLHEHTQDGIRWRVSLHPEIDRGPGISAIRFLKRSRHSKLLDQLSEWGPDGWRSLPSSRVPRVLLKRIEQELQRRNRPAAQPLPAAERLMRGSRVPGVTEAVSGGRLPFPSFLAMELVEAYLPDQYRRAKAPAH
jgi:hypothetical protein